MKLRILGPLEVFGDNGDPVIIRPPLQRSILAVLLLRPGEPCSRDWLTECMWGDHPPAGPVPALRSAVYNLRRALGSDGARIETHPGGYLAHVIAGELDLEAWRNLHVQGRAALDNRNAEGAARLLQQALELWRDPPLHDLPGTRVMTAEASRLLDQRRDAQDALMDARLALGHHYAVVGQLRELVTAEPLREHAWAQLMLALYRCGHQAEALGAATRLRNVLIEELGVDPSPEVQTLLEQILRNDPALSVAPPPAAPGVDPPPPWIPVSQLPAEPSDFTGRQAEEEAVLLRLPGQGMAVTVIGGLPGAGKTALALHAAHQARSRFPDGQLWAWLGGPETPRDPQDVLGEMLRALGVPPGGIPAPKWEREALYRSMLAGRKVLVVLDDAAAAAQVRPLLPGTSGSAVLVTSRHRLADLDGARAVEVGELSGGDATALLGKIAGRERAESDTTAAAAIAAACGFLPLPVRIAGARLAARPGLLLAELARSLADASRRLDELVIGDASVRERVAVSYRALSPRGRRAFRLLALHSPEDMPAWLAGALLGEPEAEDVPEQLADAGLLQPAGDGISPRYLMHPLLRAYAAEQLNPADLALTATALDSLYRGWLELADQADRLTPQQRHVPAAPRLRCTVAPAAAAARTAGDAVAWFERERANLVAITERALSEGRTALAADLAARQFGRQCQAGQHGDAIRIWGAIEAAAVAAGDAGAAGRARYRLAVLDADQGLWRPCMRRLAGCLITFRFAGDLEALADAQCLAARCAEADWDLQAAHHYAQQALDNGRQAGSDRIMSLSLSVLGTVLAALGSGPEGTACCREARAMAVSVDASLVAGAEHALRRATYAAGGSAAASSA